MTGIETKQVFIPYGRIDRKTYLKWSLPFMLYTMIFLTASFIPVSEWLVVKFLSLLSVFGQSYVFLGTLATVFASVGMVIFLSAKRFQDINKPWYVSLFMVIPLLFAIFWFWLLIEKGTPGEN